MIHELFSTPVYRKVTNDINFITELEEYIISSMTEENRLKKPPQSAHSDLFESKFDFLGWDSPESKKCKNLFLGTLLQFLKEVTTISDYDYSRIKIYQESWFHTVRQGGYFQTHTHPNAAWSMVLCVSQGDKEVKNERECGKLLFIDPRLNASMHLDPANKDLKRKFSFSGYRFRPENGEFFIFPSYLQHAVEPYFGNKHRITVAANFWFNF